MNNTVFSPPPSDLGEPTEPDLKALGGIVVMILREVT